MEVCQVTLYMLLLFRRLSRQMSASFSIFFLRSLHISFFSHRLGETIEGRGGVAIVIMLLSNIYSREIASDSARSRGDRNEEDDRAFFLVHFRFLDAVASFLFELTNTMS